MEFGICNLSIVPVRSDPFEQAEMVTQVLFGELLLVEEHNKKWSRIRLESDGYEGWINSLQYIPIPELLFKVISNAEAAFSNELVQLVIIRPADILMPIVLGSSLPNIKERNFLLNNKEYQYPGEIKSPGKIKKESLRDELISTAKLYLHSPYLWGGRTPFGIDCSGFTQIVYKINGIQLLRDASHQAAQGETISFLSEAKPGDLVFFDNPEGDIIHSGIILSSDKVIHASGRVRIDPIDHEGIYNENLKSYTHKLRIIKKYI